MPIGQQNSFFRGMTNRGDLTDAQWERLRPFHGYVYLSTATAAALTVWLRT